jgi:hypothetical protein
VRTDITRFPHAVLEVKLSLLEGTEAPAWVRELVDNPNRCTEVHKFSKFIHGTCTLFPGLVQVCSRVHLSKSLLVLDFLQSFAWPEHLSKGLVASSGLSCMCKSDHCMHNFGLSLHKEWFCAVGAILGG